MGKSDELMTDDEFEKLLDELEEQKAAPEGESETSSKQLSVDSAVAEATGEETAENEVGVILDPSVTIGQATEMHERLCYLLNDPATVVFQAEEVNVIDTANMQLLFAFARDRRDKDLQTKIRNPSQSFINTAKCLGMLNALAIDTAPENLT